MNCPECNLPLFDYDTRAGLLTCKAGHRWTRQGHVPAPAVELVPASKWTPRAVAPRWRYVLAGATGVAVMDVLVRLI